MQDPRHTAAGRSGNADILTTGDERPSPSWWSAGSAGRSRWQAMLTTVAAAVVAVVAVVHVVSGGTPRPPVDSVRSVALDPITFPSVLTLESPDEPGTPLGSEVGTAAEDLAVRAECSGAGTLTVSFSARPWLRLPCADGRVNSAERLVTADDMAVSRRGPNGRAFLVAQAGNTSPQTRWRVTVREVGSQLSGGHFVP